MSAEREMEDRYMGEKLLIHQICHCLPIFSTWAFISLSSPSSLLGEGAVRMLQEGVGP